VRTVHNSGGSRPTQDIPRPTPELLLLPKPVFPCLKTALNAVTVAFAKEMAAFDITVNAADPG